MREIKFRAWNTDSNEWDNQQITQVYVGLDGKIIATDGRHLWENLKCIELTQYTGLKDKYGVEIYEGDLVEHEDDIDGRWELYEACEIIYSTQVHGFCFRMDEGNSLSGYRNFEVVGNRYENPELSKEV